MEEPKHAEKESLPTKSDIEEAIGELLPEEVHIEVVDSLPKPETPFIIKCVGHIKDKFKIIVKSKFGLIVGVYLFVIDFGFDLPKPKDIIVTISKEFVKHSKMVFDFIRSEDDADSYLAKTPEWWQGIDDELDVQSGNFPVGTDFYPVSSAILQEIQKA